MKANKTREMGQERSAGDNGENSTRKNRGRAYIKQPHLKSTCQGAVIVKAAPAVLCTLPDPRPVKYAMLDQKGVLLCPTPDPRSVRALPSQITGPQITWVEQTERASICAFDAICCVYTIPTSNHSISR